MIRINELIKYLPKSHGEHGVDATLHRLVIKQRKFHEVFSNPPGGSWTQFDILKPKTNLIFRWDHIPRVPPKAKRPDLVIQLNVNDNMNFLLIESKKKISDAYKDMSRLLIQFFVGSQEYIGLIDRPPWHFKEINETEWKVVRPDIDKNERFWFKYYDRKLIKFWTGFAFALTPEYYESINDIDTKKWITLMNELIGEYNLNLVIGVLWTGKQHNPRLLSVFSEDFRKSIFGKEFIKMIKELNILPV